MAEFTQKNRLLTVDSPLGADKLLLLGFEGEESISNLFEFRLDLLSEEASIDPDKLLGKDLTFSVQMGEGEARPFHGMVRRFEALGSGRQGLTSYRATVVPSLWLLTRTTDCRIFQKLSLPDILTQVLDDLGVKNYTKSLKGTYPVEEYVVQYRESDFNFVSRLMEQVGIFYFFKHEKGKHTLVLTDDKRDYYDAQQALVKHSTGSLLEPHVSSWSHASEMRSGRATLTDYDFEKPKSDLETKTDTLHKLDGWDKRDRYDYPGKYLVKGTGTDLSKFRMEAEEVAGDVAHGESTLASFSPGAKFKFEEHEVEAEKGASYAIARIRHHAVDPTYTQAGGSGAEYHNSFECIPSDVVHRPEQTTPRPRVHGPQTAVVVGPSGEEIYTDKYGRIKVQFHWDREGKENQDSSCWMRVSQPWAGNGWGSMVIPRIGMEVVVEFLEGDPDRPLVTGCVYNGANAVPYELNANKTQSGFKTRSSPKGSPDNFNELRFEDKKGEEHIYFHAEKDFQRHVENDDMLEVEHDQTIKIINDRIETIEEGKEEVTIKKGDRKHQIEKGNETLLVDSGNRGVTIGKGNDKLEIKMGDRATKIAMGKSTTEAMQSIELKVGQSSIKIDQSGITLKGMMIKVEGMAMTEVKAPMTTVKGDGMLTLKGGITMIN